jgi:heme/copper-type cytochrome/quinol oxidase subunit 2
MPIVVEVKSRQEFDAWLASQKSALRVATAE